MLVYALSTTSAEKQQRARAWLELLLATGNGVLSTQALTELANVCLHRMEPRWSPERVAEHVQALSRAFPTLAVTPAVVVEALRGVRHHQMSFFDAQMWAVARLNQVPAILTQDMATGTEIDGVLIVDPFGREPA